MSKPRSYSQLGQYERCPYSYYLQRIVKVWQRPAAWLPMGTAVHEAVEKWELSGRTMTLEEAQQVFRESYAAETNRLLGDTPNALYWFASGPYKGPADIKRRWKLGHEHVERYIRWYTEKHPEEKPFTWFDQEQGKTLMAVELPFTIDLEGVKVRGFIDWVGYSGSRLIVRDNKTGNTPGGPEQLATYALAVEDKFDLASLGISVDSGDFFMTRTGKPTVPYQLTKAVKVQLADDFHQMDEAVNAGDFPPKPESRKCMFCDVSSACKYRV